MVGQNQDFTTVGTLIHRCAETMEKAGVFCGHGTDNYGDEAASLVFHVANLEHDVNVTAYSQCMDAKQVDKIMDLLRLRVEGRVPMPYLLNEAWFAGLQFFIDQRVLIPRSPFAELVRCRFEPWLEPASVKRVLEIGTGCGCIAIACALAFPDSEVLATDLSAAALEVARINVVRHGLQQRVQLMETDLFAGLDGHFDLIISNPPYVPEHDAAGLPAEYSHEPRAALFSGLDGLESSRRILQDAAGHLAGGGTLALEVGAGWQTLETAFPRLPFIWPEFEFGGEGIALIKAADLALAASR
jgi:ribosomal protein L3 glutamine methyltransferase